MKGSLSPFRSKSDKGIDIVERVKKKVRVELGFETLEFYLAFFRTQFQIAPS